MRILLHVLSQPPQYYNKMSLTSSWRTLFVLICFFCFDSSAALDALGGSTGRFFTITA